MMSTKRKAEGHIRPAGKLRTMKSGRSRVDSERDSGFSDVGSVSAMDTADSPEDSPRAVLGSSSGPQPSQLAVVGGSYSNLSSVIIMNNVLLKQPEENPPALKPWAFSPAVEVVQPVVQQPQVVFLQPVVSRSKEASSKHRRPKKYLPILKAYPKIAPHPGHGHGASGRSTTSSSSSSGYSSSSSGSVKSDFSSHRERSHHRNKHQKRSLSVYSSRSSSTASLTPASSPVPPLLLRRLAVPLTDSSCSSSPASERPSPAVSRSGFSPSQCLTPSNCLEDSEAPPLLDLAPRVDAGEQHDADLDAEPDAKRKRFCNTYNILNKSGLLDITLRTKELVRQNRRAQTDLDRLKEQTELFLKALQTGDSSIFVRLQSSLQEEDREREREKEKEMVVQTNSTG